MLSINRTKTNLFIKCATFFVDNYYWLFVIVAIIDFFLSIDLDSILILGTLYSFCVILVYNYTFKQFDVLIFGWIFYQLLSVLFSSYDLQLFYYGIKLQIIPILFYFLGRSSLFSNNNLMEKAYYPLLISMLFGLYTYFLQPDWYLSKKMSFFGDDLGSVTSQSFYESTRLSSFWPWSYFMGYSSLLFIMYFFKELFKDKIKFKFISFIIISILVLFFAQQRVSIVFFMIYIIFMFKFSGFSHKSRWYFAFAIFASVALGIFYVIVNYISPEYLNYILQRSVKSDNSIVGSRFAMYLYHFSISLFGEGLGKYGHMAYYLHNSFAIGDNDYLRLIMELGVFGLIYLFIIYLYSFIRFIKFKKYFKFEIMVLFFFSCAMIGGTPLENSVMQPFFWWFCIGRLFNRELIDYKIKNKLYY